MKSDQEYQFLRSLQKESVKADHDAPGILKSLYTLCFGDTHPPRSRADLSVESWESSVLARAVDTVARLDARYVQLFHDPRRLPVTYYWKQKQTSILLDRFSSQILWEALKRSSRGSGYNTYEEIDSDDFLDKPILFLKQEAREGRFALVKQSSGLMSLEKRFLEKVNESGIDLTKLAYEDFHYL